MLSRHVFLPGHTAHTAIQLGSMVSYNFQDVPTQAAFYSGCRRYYREGMKWFNISPYFYAFYAFMLSNASAVEAGG